MLRTRPRGSSGLVWQHRGICGEMITGGPLSFTMAPPGAALFSPFVTRRLDADAFALFTHLPKKKRSDEIYFAPKKMYQLAVNEIPQADVNN